MPGNLRLFGRSIAKKKIAHILLVFVFIASISFISINRYFNTRDVCGDAFLEEAIPLLDVNKAAQLGTIVKKNEYKKRFDQSPNCLYVATAYYLNLGDPINARDYFDKLDKHYDSPNSFSKKLRPYLIDKATLESSIEFQEKVMKSMGEQTDKNWGI